MNVRCRPANRILSNATESYFYFPLGTRFSFCLLLSSMTFFALPRKCKKAVRGCFAAHLSECMQLFMNVAPSSPLCASQSMNGQSCHDKNHRKSFFPYFFLFLFSFFFASLLYLNACSIIRNSTMWKNTVTRGKEKETQPRGDGNGRERNRDRKMKNIIRKINK